MFPADFTQQMIALNGIELNVVTGGNGPPLILLHGFPQTSVIWHRIAPELAQHFSLVMPDLRGYGGSSAPPGDPEHKQYSKREMAKDIIALADRLGIDRFALAGHDRGGRVGYRLVLDHPGRVTKFCAIDIIPTLDAWEDMDTAATVSAFHWSFLAAKAPLPEEIIEQNPNLFYGYLISSNTAIRARFRHNAKTTAPAPPSIGCTTRPTATLVIKWTARYWCYGAPVISATRPAHRWIAGANGPGMLAR
jgi:haloacetate dehalogenase